MKIIYKDNLKYLCCKNKIIKINHIIGYNFKEEKTYNDVGFNISLYIEIYNINNEEINERLMHEFIHVAYSNDYDKKEKDFGNMIIKTKNKIIDMFNKYNIRSEIMEIF